MNIIFYAISLFSMNRKARDLVLPCVYPFLSFEKPRKDITQTMGAKMIECRNLDLGNAIYIEIELRMIEPA